MKTLKNTSNYSPKVGDAVRHIQEGSLHVITHVSKTSSYSGGWAVKVAGQSGTTWGISNFVPCYKESNIIRLFGKIDEN